MRLFVLTPMAALWASGWCNMLAVVAPTAKDRVAIAVFGRVTASHPSTYQQM